MRTDLPRFLTREGRHLPGERRLVQVANPAAGAEWAAGPQGGRIWTPLGAFALLTTSVQAANRTLGLQILIQGIQVYINWNTTPRAASLTAQAVYQDVQALAPAAQQSLLWPIPFTPIPLRPGDTIGSLTFGLQTADQYSQVALLIEEVWYDDQQISTEHIERAEDLRAELRAAGVLPAAGY